MSNIEQYFEETAASLATQGVEVTRMGESWRLAAGDDVAMVAFGDDDGDVVCHATVGSFANVSVKDIFLEDALKANCFWGETNGATLSVKPDTDTLVLADRREANFVESADGLEAFFAQFFGTLRKWKRYLADSSLEGVPAAEPPAGAEVVEVAEEEPYLATETEMRFMP